MKFKDPRKLIAKIKQDVEDASATAIAKVNVELDRVIESLDEFSDLGFVSQDIVDTGRLRDSKIITANPNGVTFSYAPVSPENGYPYAPAVYLGFFAWGKYWVEGRPWTLRAIKNENPTVNLVNALTDKGYNVNIKYDGVRNLTT